MSGRKIPSELENPIDDIIISIGEKLNKYFKLLGFTANGLTTVSTIFAILTLYCYYHNNTKYAALFYVIQYMFDCFDGNFARKYNQVTQFGDYFDHVKDIMINTGLLLLFLTKNNISMDYKILVMFLVSSLFYYSMSAIGCQQKYYDDKSVLEGLKPLCSKKENLKYLKYLGTGTYTLFVTLIILWFN